MQKTESLWQQKVEEAKEILALKFDGQMRVGKLALDVCEITWGGNSGKNTTIFTIKRFARSIGVNERTLSNWVGIYRNVYKKLPAATRKTTTFNSLQKTARFVGPDDTQVKVRAVFKDVGSKSFDNRVLGYVGELRSILHNLTVLSGVWKLRDDTLEEILFYAQEVSNTITDSRPNLKPVNHKKAGKFSIGNTKRANSGSLSIRMTAGLLGLVKHVQKTKGYQSPIRVGEAIYTTKQTKTAKKLAALRHFQKLEAAGFATKNKQGHYKLNSAGMKL